MTYAERKKASGRMQAIILDLNRRYYSFAEKKYVCGARYVLDNLEQLSEFRMCYTKKRYK